MSICRLPDGPHRPQSLKAGDYLPSGQGDHRPARSLRCGVATQIGPVFCHYMRINRAQYPGICGGKSRLSTTVLAKFVQFSTWLVSGSHDACQTCNRQKKLRFVALTATVLSLGWSQVVLQRSAGAAEGNGADLLGVSHVPILSWNVKADPLRRSFDAQYLSMPRMPGIHHNRERVRQGLVF
jgi:hypothetical protein